MKKENREKKNIAQNYLISLTRNIPRYFWHESRHFSMHYKCLYYTSSKIRCYTRYFGIISLNQHVTTSITYTFLLLLLKFT